MKASALLASLLFTACGSVSAPPGTSSGDDVSDLDAGIDASEDGGSESPPDAPETPDASEPDAPGPSLPLLVETAHAATGASAITSVTYTTSPALIELVRSTGSTARYNVLEQRIIPTVTGPLPVRIAVANPTGTYARSIANIWSDPIEAWFPVPFVCSNNGVSTGDPRCTMQAPAASLAASSGALSNVRWRTVVIDEATGAVVDACIDGGGHLDCVLPNPSGARYKIVVSADRFAQLWRTDLMFREISHLLGPLTGDYAPNATQCTHMTGEAGTTKISCDQYLTFNGWYGLDSASIAFDPMSITISSGTASQTFVSPALSWNPGNNDLPGQPY